MVFNTYLFARDYQRAPQCNRLGYICGRHRARATIIIKVFKGLTMNKTDIINKLQTDEKALECLIESSFASDLKIELEAKRQYISSLLEWIKFGSKV